jgi:hypothetical protein
MTAQTLKDAAEIRQFVADRLDCGTDLTDAFYAGAYGALTNANPRFVSAVRPMADRSADAGKGHADAAHAVYVDGLANAWRTPSATPALPRGMPARNASLNQSAADAETSREDARAAYEVSLQNAWKGIDE